MPAIIDHDERRGFVAAVAARLVASQGADGLTFRDIAKASGFSTSVVSHYFDSKQDLLTFVFEGAADRGVERLKSAVKNGLPLQKCVEAILPLDDARIEDWHVVLAFWGEGHNDEHLKARQQKRNREMLGLIEKLLVKENGVSEPTSRADVRARTIVTLIIGLATQAIFDPKFWTPQKQKAVIADVLR